MSDPKAIERANSYRHMMNTWTWVDFEKNILESIRQDALENGISSTTLEQVYIQRGVVKCVDRIKGELGFILENTGK